MRKHIKLAREARWDTDEAYIALGALQTQMEWVHQHRAATQAARADDQAVLVGLRGQLEAACAKAFTATRQWILANNHAALAEATRDRVVAEAV